MKKKVIIIGGGAAGMACAVFLARKGIPVTLLEKNEKTGKKLYITGKGRCNFTNACEPAEFLENVVSNRKFLYSAAYGFTSADAAAFFEELGLKTKIERGNRAFPASDHSSDVIRALNTGMKRCGVDVRLGKQGEVTEILADAGADRENFTGSTDKKVDQLQPAVRGVRTADGSLLEADCIVLATGGLSYPSTGSTGDGFRFAQELGIRVTEMYPSLTALRIEEQEMAAALEGLSLRNVTLTVKKGKKELYSAFGEMLFTRTGISGPIVLSASAQLVKVLEKEALEAFIDLKPALTDEQLDARLTRELEMSKKKQFINAAAPLFPAKLLPVIVGLSGIGRERIAGSITKKERESFAQLIRHFPLTINGHGGFNEAVITQGGIRISEVDPHTMRIKKYENLYAAGEVLDVDALTGGFNLQIAWSTAHLAAEAISSLDGGTV